MKYFKVICTAALLFVICSAFTFPFLRTSHEVYIFGVSASFKDTVVYFTDIQIMDSVKLKEKWLLPSRQGYSEELKDYVSGTLKGADPTCMIFFSRDFKALQKKRAKLVKIYRKDPQNNIKFISRNDFKFTKPADSDTEYVQ